MDDRNGDDEFGLIELRTRSSESKNGKIQTNTNGDDDQEELLSENELISSHMEQVNPNIRNCEDEQKQQQTVNSSLLTSTAYGNERHLGQMSSQLALSSRNVPSCEEWKVDTPPPPPPPLANDSGSEIGRIKCKTNESASSVPVRLVDNPSLVGSHCVPQSHPLDIVTTATTTATTTTGGDPVLQHTDGVQCPASGQCSVFDLAQQALKQNSSSYYPDPGERTPEVDTERTPLLETKSVATVARNKRIRFLQGNSLDCQHNRPSGSSEIVPFPRSYSNQTFSDSSTGSQQQQSRRHHRYNLHHHSFHRCGQVLTQRHLEQHSEQCLALDCIFRDRYQCSVCPKKSTTQAATAAVALPQRDSPASSTTSLITSKAKFPKYNTFARSPPATTMPLMMSTDSESDAILNPSTLNQRHHRLDYYRNTKTSSEPEVEMTNGANYIPPSNGGVRNRNAAFFFNDPLPETKANPTSPLESSLAIVHESTTTASSSSSREDKIDRNTFYSITLPKLKYLKVFLLASLIIYTLISFIFIHEKHEKWTNVAVHNRIPAFVDLSHSLDLMFPVWKLRARGAFLPKEYANLTSYSVVFTIVQLLNDSRGGDRNGAYRVVKKPWAAPIAPTSLNQYMNPKEVEHIFKLTRGDAYDHVHRYQLRIDTNAEESIALTVNMAGFSELSADGIILASAVLIFLYTLIIFEVVNRTLAAMLGATAAITCLTLIRDRPSLEKVVSWLDVETLCLLFGMMILVAILCETGFFDYLAVVAFQLAKGRTWPLIFTLCFFTGVLSAFLDNVTTILLMTPVTIRLCEIKNIDPKHVLISLVIFSNIGGAATPVGDPPNVIIISSAKIKQQGVDFGRFTFHMMPGIVISFIATLVYIRIYYRNLSNLEFEDASSSGEPGLTEVIANSSMNKDSVSSRDDTIEFEQLQKIANRDAYLKSKLEEHEKHLKENNSFVCNSDCHPTPDFDVEASFDFTKLQGLEASSASKMGNISIGPQRCISCSNLAEFCTGQASNKESLFDDKRVFRSTDELKREIEVWKRACNSIAGYSRDENSVRQVLNRKVEMLETILSEHCYETIPPEDNYQSVLAELQSKYKIRDRPLLIKSGIVMTLVISLFFMQSIPNLDLSLGWIAILGAILLLILSDRHELESIIARVEWSTLIFFAALFVVMEALAELKFLWWIGRLTQDFINSVPEHSRLSVAILVFLWVSAFASSFIDNIPLTTVMVKIIEDLAENNEFNIPLMPLIYALAFGACLGGNGTLIGASSNVVCAGVAEQHGYRFTFMDFFRLVKDFKERVLSFAFTRVGFPIMLITVAISTVYLMLCHVVFNWNF